MMLVSIIIPYYKKKNYIKKTINSILRQTYKKFEVIIINDEPGELSKNILSFLQKKDSRIKIINNKKNIGAGKSRNKGIKIAKGKYIAFIDSDDLWKKNKLIKQIEFMHKKNIEISHTSYEIIDNNGKITGKRKANLISFKKIIKSCDVGLSSVILKKNLLSKITKFPNLKTKEDFVLWLKITRKGINIDPLDVNLVQWRNVHNSLSSSILRKLLDGYTVYRKFLNFGRLKSFFYLIILSLNYVKKSK